MDFDGSQPIVLDSGTSTIKSGYSGGFQPKVILNNEVGRTKHQKYLMGSSRCGPVLGEDVRRKRGLLSINYPMRHSVVQDWDDMELVWSFMYKELDAIMDEHPVLMTETPLASRKYRARIGQVFFEKFFVPGMHFMCQDALSLYASGRTTGLVMGFGEGTTHCVPVYEGFALPHAIVQHDLGGQDVTEELQNQLRKLGHSNLSLSICKAIKEAKCYVSSGTPNHMVESEFDDSFTLPDGQTVDIRVPASEAPEIMFAPNKFGLDCPGIHHNILKSIEKTDIELRAGLYENILLSGGSTLLPGFAERILSELKLVTPSSICMRVYAPSDRLFSAWAGGSMLSSLSTFKKMWIPKFDYEEHGDAVFHRRCGL